ncbi:hypothetical protein PSAC2689_10079 [Paraburkholderia sacchari]
MTHIGWKHMICFTMKCKTTQHWRQYGNEQGIREAGSGNGNPRRRVDVVSALRRGARISVSDGPRLGNPLGQHGCI